MPTVWKCENPKSVTQAQGSRQLVAESSTIGLTVRQIMELRGMPMRLILETQSPEGNDGFLEFSFVRQEFENRGGERELVGHLYREWDRRNNRVCPDGLELMVLND
jgi:hypothetical protein